MKLDKIANSGNDEFYTPAYAIYPIVKRLKPGSTIWCPFDTQESLFVKILRDNSFNVIHSHISQGKDFFTMSTPSKIDYIISNPPYSLKNEVFTNLFSRGVPFAMLVGVVGLFESQKRFELFRDNPFEILYFNRRVSYFKDYSDQKPALNPPFSSVYLCQGILESQIEFEEIDKSKYAYEK